DFLWGQRSIKLHDAVALVRSAGHNLQKMDEFACSFCAKRRREVRKLISGPKVFICDECVQLCNEIIAKEEPATERRFPRPREIYDELERYAVGQHRAKKALSV